MAWAPPNPDLDRWKERLASLHTIVAEYKDTIIGFASYEDNGHFEFLYVHPKFARQKIATQLYRYIESSLRSIKISKIFTESSLAAKPFFEHCGFSVDAEELVERNGVQFRRYAMHKQIIAADGK